MEQSSPKSPLTVQPVGLWKLWWSVAYKPDWEEQAGSVRSEYVSSRDSEVRQNFSELG